MSQLIQMRQRIKAIETIKKITSAMRLISRSFHTRMSKEKGNLKSYQEEVENLLKHLHASSPLWQSPFFFPEQNTKPRKLIILIGAQKGLCGNYNTEITYWIKKNKSLLIAPDTEVFVIGKKTDDYITHLNIKKSHVFKELTLNTIEALSEEIITILKNAQPYYTHVSLIASFSQTFFSHKLKTVQLIPAFITDTRKEESDYDWQGDPHEILETLSEMCLRTKIHITLFESLLGEQASRFIAMDNATRNANKFLDAMHLQYNKARQAKITKELTELSAHFMG
ncbi:F0F1 ATP synthase subunit gamma [Candidatus Babeliales bacterium]|nr:F0F1 ATP synthase subunit gamma [Candidatus Babeliales bacterium]